MTRDDNDAREFGKALLTVETFRTRLGGAMDRLDRCNVIELCAELQNDQHTISCHMGPLFNFEPETSSPEKGGAE